MTLNTKYNLITILGPTATGKTRLAACLAAEINGEIISADSRQVYRRMNLGTGKDYEDYLVNGQTISSHLVDIHEPGYKYNVYEYQRDFFQVYSNIRARNKFPVLCGGTGMYIDAVSKGYKLISVPVNDDLRQSLKEKSLKELEQILAGFKKLHNKTDVDTQKRAIRAIEIEVYYRDHDVEEEKLPEVKNLFIGVTFDRESRRRRITERLHARLDEGMLDEVQTLLNEGIPAEDLVYYGLEYKYLTLHLIGELDYDTMVKKLNVAIHQFAKRQMTWFRKMEREGCQIHWLNGPLPLEEKIERIKELLLIAD